MRATIAPPELGARTDSRLVDSTVGIVNKCFEIVLEPDDPRLFCFFAEAADTSRYGKNEPRCNQFGCAVGFTRESAAWAAVGECVERYSAANYDPRRLPYATYEEVRARGKAAVDPESFALFSAAQYAAFRTENPASPMYSPFTRDTRVTWVPGRDAATGLVVWVPGPFVYLPYRHRADEARIVESISTGTAFGTSFEDAALRAVLEAVERDAVSIAWLNSFCLPRVRLDANDRIATLYQERFARYGVEYVLVDATLDVSIPTFLGFLIDERGGTIISSATRLSPYDCAVKTLIEAAQGRIAWKREVVSGPRERFKDDFSDVVNFPDHSKVYMLREMRPHIEHLWSSVESTRVADIPDLSTGDSASDLRTCVSLLGQAGLQTVLVDVTSEDVRSAGYFVVRAVIPGLHAINARHVTPYLGGRRLYEVGTKIGLQSRPPREDELNLFLHPFP